MRKKKTQITESISREEAQELMALFAAADAEQKKIEGQMEMSINKIRDKYSGRLHELQEKMDIVFDRLEAFANQNEDLFEKKKSIDYAHGKIGFRTGTPKLKTKRGFTWAAVTDLIKDHLPAYVVTKDAPNKEKILADREQLGNDGLLTKIKVEVVQDETFYVESKSEDIAA